MSDKTFYKQIKTLQTALYMALNYVECSDGRRGTLNGCAMKTETWDRLHSIVESAGMERNDDACLHCGSLKDPYFSRVEPMGYFCADCDEGEL